MPQYKVTLEDIFDGEHDTFTVWASDTRSANLQALKQARKLLGRPAFEVVETIDMTPGIYRPALKTAQTRRNSKDGPVITRYHDI